MSARRRQETLTRRRWSDADLVQLCALYPDTPTLQLARKLKRTITAVYATARALGITKSAAYLASPAGCRLRRGDNIGVAYQFKKGHVPANKGLRRPGWARGRMVETQFKKGGFPVNRDPDFYVLGALRVNTDGYIDMRVSFDKGGKGWRALHRILWEDAHGSVPRGHVVIFKNRDKLDVALDNLELITFAENMRRNTIHNLPAPLRDTIQLLGQLRRRINEKQDRRSAGSPVRDAGGPAR